MLKSIEEMTRDEIEFEIDHLQSYYDSCEESGQGISSKEAIRMRRLKEAYADRGV